MTDEIRTWGSTAGGNNVSQALFPEGQPPSTVNDGARELQAAIRRQWNKAQWFAIGDTSGPATFTFLTATSFRVQGVSLTSEYQVGRRVRATGSATGTITGTITASTANGGNTDVTVVWDSGALQSESLLVEIGIVSAIGSALPARIDHGLLIGGDLEFTGNMLSPLGPWRIAGITKAETADSPIAIPSGTKMVVVRAYGAGGGGSGSGSSFTTNGSAGAQGGTLTVTSSPSGVSMTVSGGRPSGVANGQSLNEIVTSTVSGSSFNYIRSSFGAKGGLGAKHGINGGDGSYIEAYLLNPTITQLNLSGGAGGSGGSGSGANGDGGDGQNAFVIAAFYR